MDYAPIIRREKRSGLCRQEAHEVAAQGVDGEDAGVARDDELLAGTGKHHVQLTVDETGAAVGISLDKTVGSEELQLVGVLNGEREDDDIALTTLIALHGINGYLQKRRDVQLFYLPADDGNLVAIGNDYTYGGVGIEGFMVFLVDALQLFGHDPCLIGIHLVRQSCILTELRGDEQKVGVGRFLLMGQWNRFQMLVGVEHPTGEIGYGRMHTSLLMEHTLDVGRSYAKQPFEKRLPTVGESDAMQQRIVCTAIPFFLLHHCRQLLMVANEDEAVDTALTVYMRGKETDDVGLEYLTGLIDDCQRERPQVEDFRMTQ